MDSIGFEQSKHASFLSIPTFIHVTSPSWVIQIIDFLALTMDGAMTDTPKNLQIEGPKLHGF